MRRTNRTTTAAWVLSAMLLTACTGATNLGAASPNTAHPDAGGASSTPTGSKPHACAPVPSQKAVESLAPGQVRVTKMSVTSRQDVVRRLGSAGFPVLIVLPFGVPTGVEFDLESDRELIARTVYRLPGGRTVNVLQTCAIHFPLVGRDVQVRGRRGINDAGSVRWTERGYMLGVDPGKERYTRALAWHASNAP